jgi:hypothetical protein
MIRFLEVAAGVGWLAAVLCRARAARCRVSYREMLDGLARLVGR